MKQKRRQRERKTDYKKRLGMLKSGKMRVVIRKTNRYLIIQCVKSEEAKDKIILGITSKELLNHGWESKNSLKSISASYLTGYLIGKKIKEKGYHTILDIGLARNASGGRIYAALKGIVDAGAKINFGEEAFPSEERISGKHLNEKIQKNFIKVKEKIK